jgi:hypothetical protein
MAQRPFRTAGINASSPTAPALATVVCGERARLGHYGRQVPIADGLGRVTFVVLTARRQLADRVSR